MEGFTTLTVADIEHDTDESALITFAERLPFRHGQHLVLRREFAGEEVRRSYSLCSRAPDGALRIGVKRVPDGVMSTWLTRELRPGDEIEALAPSGNFTHEPAADTPERHMMIAAGSGITPIFSVMATVLATQPDSEVDLLYINRASNSTMLIDDLEDLRDAHLGRVRITYAFTREHGDAELLSGRPDRGRLEQLIDAGLIRVDADHAWLCGPLALVDDARSVLIDRGMPSDRVHLELFGTEGAKRPTTAEARSTNVVATGRATLHGRQSGFEVREGESILDAVRRVRPDTPFSCQAGVCSTCQARLLCGEVEMEVNYGLTEAEIARGLVLTCQSQPTGSDEIVVDFDV
ncbi:MAG: phenylacetic acid degradation protein, partial [Actinobacteria bacterium]|nr:phenylacetic acid degradation protein [Actinomycetota bacterium]